VPLLFFPEDGIQKGLAGGLIRVYRIPSQSKIIGVVSSAL